MYSFYSPKWKQLINVSFKTLSNRRFMTILYYEIRCPQCALKTSHSAVVPWISPVLLMGSYSTYLLEQRQDPGSIPKTSLINKIWYNKHTREKNYDKRIDRNSRSTHLLVFTAKKSPNNALPLYTVAMLRQQVLVGVFVFHLCRLPLKAPGYILARSPSLSPALWRQYPGGHRGFARVSLNECRR